MNGIRFDPTITLGVLVHLGVLVAVIVGAFWKLRLEVKQEIQILRGEVGTRLSVMESRVGDLWESWKRNGEK